MTSRASLAYKGLREIPREFLRSLGEMQVTELDLSHNELTYPFAPVNYSLCYPRVLCVDLTVTLCDYVCMSVLYSRCVCNCMYVYVVVCMYNNIM